MRAQTLVRLLGIALVFQAFVLPLNGYSQDDKKAEELRRKIAELERKKAELNRQAQDKIDKMKTKETESQSTDEIIVRYEKLLEGCMQKKSDRCADVMYTLSKLYYDQARDGYIAARNKYENDMNEWEKNPRGRPEPVNPVPDYSKSLRFYQRSIAEYPDNEAADEAYYQIGSIMMLQGDLDASKVAFEKVIEKNPNGIRAPGAHFRLADFCFMDRDFTCALKHLEKINLSQINPEVREMAHYRKAEIYYNRAEFDKAADLFYQYVDKCDAGEYAKKDLRKEALEYLAICFSDMPGGGQKAIDFFKKVGNRPYRDYVIYTVGMKNFEHGQYDDAIVSLQNAIDNFPNYKDAPVAQNMIIACWVIKKKYEQANEQREKMVKKYWIDGEWATRNSADKPAIENARIEVRKALSQIPIYYHAEAQKNKKKDYFEKAIKWYNEFFTKFPDDKWKVYEFKYNVAEIYNSLNNYAMAAESYDFVAQQNLATFPKYQDDVLDTLGMDQEEKERLLKDRTKKRGPVSISQEDAGFNAIVALDNLRKQKKVEDNLSDEQLYNLPETKKFLDYITAFQVKFPQSQTTPEVLYLGANVHYSAKNYQMAITGFKAIMDKYPTSKFANRSMRMLANCYTASGDYDLALNTYDRLLSTEKQGSNEYVEILDLAAGSLFKKAEGIRKTGNHAAAADAFKAIFTRFPSSKVADRGWFESGVCYEEGGDLAMAAVTFADFGDKFTKSDLRERAYLRAAENYKKLNKWEDAANVYAAAADKVPKADFAIPSLSAAYECYTKIDAFGKAGKVSESIYQKYPDDKRTPIALYNAGLIYEKGKLYNDAIRIYTILAERYPQSEYALEGFYAIGYCYEKLGDNVKMAKAFTDFASKFTADKSKQINAIVRAAEAYYNMKDLANAEKNCEAAIDIYEKFGKKIDIDVVAVSKAYYTLGEIQQQRFRNIKLTGANEKAIQEALKEKTKALEPVLKAYAKAIELGVGEWTMRSTYMIGMSFVEMAHEFRNQKLFGTSDQQVASKIKIVSGLEKYYLKAQEKFAWVVETAYEQNIKNEWVTKSTDQFAEMAFRKGRLLEEVGEIFKSAPVPKGLPAEDKQAYIDVLEEKYLEALDASLPKYEEGLKELANLGIANNRWEDSLRAHIKFIQPGSESLSMAIQPRTPKVQPAMQPQKDGAVAAGSRSGDDGKVLLSDDRLSRNMRRIQNIVNLNISVDEKVQQLRSIEADARREIRIEEDSIADLKKKAGAN